MLAKINNYVDTVDCIYYLLNNTKKAEQIANNALKLVEKYSWENRCKRILSKATKVTM